MGFLQLFAHARGLAPRLGALHLGAFQVALDLIRLLPALLLGVPHPVGLGACLVRFLPGGGQFRARPPGLFLDARQFLLGGGERFLGFLQLFAHALGLGPRLDTFFLGAFQVALDAQCLVLGAGALLQGSAQLRAELFGFLLGARAFGLQALNVCLDTLDLLSRLLKVLLGLIPGVVEIVPKPFRLLLHLARGLLGSRQLQLGLAQLLLGLLNLLLGLVQFRLGRLPMGGDILLDAFHVAAQTLGILFGACRGLLGGAKLDMGLLQFLAYPLGFGLSAGQFGLGASKTFAGLQGFALGGFRRALSARQIRLGMLEFLENAPRFFSGIAEGSLGLQRLFPSLFRLLLGVLKVRVRLAPPVLDPLAVLFQAPSVLGQPFLTFLEGFAFSLYALEVGFQAPHVVGGYAGRGVDGGCHAMGRSAARHIGEAGDDSTARQRHQVGDERPAVRMMEFPVDRAFQDRPAGPGFGDRLFAAESEDIGPVHAKAKRALGRLGEFGKLSVEGHQFAVGIHHSDALVHVLDDDVEQPRTLRRVALRLFELVDITRDANENPVFPKHYLGHGKFHGEGRAVLVPAGHFTGAFADDLALARLEIFVEVPVVQPRIGRGHQNREVFADELLGLVAEHSFRRPVERFDLAGFADGGDSVGGVVHDAVDPPFALAQAFIGYELADPELAHDLFHAEDRMVAPEHDPADDQGQDRGQGPAGDRGEGQGRRRPAGGCGVAGGLSHAQ